MKMFEKIQNTALIIKELFDFTPEVGIILGTGLGGLVSEIDILHTIDYKDIPNFPISTVEGHKGALIFGLLGGKRVVVMQGRFHYYEGYTAQQVVFPVRVMKLLGIKRLFVSNASGGINPNFKVGDLMVITDHINLIPNPLIGANIDELGVRFPDMSNVYDLSLIEKAREIASRDSLKLQYGCYVGVTGPTFETQKEYRYFSAIGGDSVGMSTTPEVIAARHMLLPVFAMSVITDEGLSGVEATHESVQIEGAKAAKRMTHLFIEILKNI